jgi:phosphopantothenate-cysteine ligase/phosphopantothenoylcysteine decarboxylase/phosphopantothenate--cysteine ligase
MRILVTAGNTQTPIDQVRCITNIFTGQTGTQIALEGVRRGHSVVLLTSHPELVGESGSTLLGKQKQLAVHPYRTFDDLRGLMSEELGLGRACSYQAIVHSAAVSDYSVAGVFTLGDTNLDPPRPLPYQRPRLEAYLTDVQAGKVKSSYDQLWLKLVPTEKLVDRIRSPWNFQGILVKFKLEVGVNDEELLSIAEASRVHSDADLMVANTFEGRRSHAYLGPLGGRYERVERPMLAARVLDEVEALAAQRGGG